MSTEYFLNINVCACCGSAKEKLLIGSASFGWYFALVSYSDENMPKDLSDWDKLFSEPNNKITNEYGDVLSREEMLSIIKNGSADISPEERFTGGITSKYISLDTYLKVNHAELGSRNLLRRELDSYCAAHGPDDLPYDLVKSVI